MPGNFRPVQCHFVLRSDLSCQLQAVGNFIAAQNSMAKNTPAASNTFNVCLPALGFTWSNPTLLPGQIQQLQVIEMPGW